MQMDWMAKCFTGANSELLKNYESKLKVVEKPAEENLKERTQQDEDNMLSAFESAGYKIIEKP